MINDYIILNIGTKIGQNGEIMLIRKTLPADVNRAARIYDEARKFMRESGNPTQWADGYPNADTVIEDIEAGVGYVCEENGELLAVFMYAEGNDPTYDKIYEGSWLDNAPYAVIHRIAVSANAHGKGVAAYCFAECFRRFPNIKIDTHRDNIPMQRALERAGFKRCGIIYLESGEERIAYQKNE